MSVQAHLLSPLLVEIERLAWLETPDWDDWCGNACARISPYLDTQGIEHAIESAGDDPEDTVGPNWPWGTHTFIRLADGSVLDPTISQFQGEGHPRLQGSPSSALTALLPREHPAARYYEPHA
jgi:hypothetical protein